MTLRLSKRRVAAGVGAFGLLLGLYAFAIEPYWIDVTRHEVGAGSREMVVLHLTDLHFSTPGVRERKVLEVMAEARPDLIVITGDSIVRSYDQAAFTEFMGKLQAPLGVFACPGNWEDWVGPSVYECYRRAGVQLLDDKTTSLKGAPVDLVGFSSYGSTVPDGSGRFRIALCHYPVILPPASKKGVNVVFAGHTHGGQVRLPFIGALHTPFASGPYEAGWYQEGSTRMYVSRGVGTSILSVRFLCRPEVAVHRLRYDEKR
jgi:predicted MPP superfamily phosphohydrolase